MFARKKSGFTLIELLVVIAIIAILAAILFPVFARAREQARKSTCASNLQECAIALNTYYNDYDATLPSSAVTYNSEHGSTDTPTPSLQDQEELCFGLGPSVAACVLPPVTTATGGTPLVTWAQVLDPRYQEQGHMFCEHPTPHFPPCCPQRLIRLDHPLPTRPAYRIGIRYSDQIWQDPFSLALLPTLV